MNTLPAHSFYIYLVMINLISGTVFSFDKIAARRQQRRIPERTLHLLEISGGIFINFLLMYTLRHKNRKFSYFGWSWLVLIGWLIIIYFIVIQ
jgi:Predicted membrane protein